MPLRIVENSTVNECREGIRQCVRSTNFNQWNPHLSPAEVAALQAQVPVWPPDKPVLSPYAATHGEYAQIRVQGTKLLAHRVAYKSYYGVNLPKSDVSHTLYIGALAARNIAFAILICEYTNMFRNLNPLASRTLTIVRGCSVRVSLTEKCTSGRLVAYQKPRELLSSTPIFRVV